MSKRLDREKETVKNIILIHCKNKSDDEICNNCEELIKYALRRLDSCPFGEEKPVCAKCKIHCYELDKREKIKTVMKKSGYKMLFYHPILLFLHFIDSFK